MDLFNNCSDFEASDLREMRRDVEALSIGRALPADFPDRARRLLEALDDAETEHSELLARIEALEDAENRIAYLEKENAQLLAQAEAWKDLAAPRTRKAARR